MGSIATNEALVMPVTKPLSVPLAEGGQWICLERVKTFEHVSVDSLLPALPEIGVVIEL